MERLATCLIACLCLLRAQGFDLTVTQLSDVHCFGDSTGIAKVVASNGAAPYSYLWNTVPPQANDTAFGLPAGTYTVTVTDFTGATATASAIIREPSQLQVTLTIIHPSCGGAGGSIVANPMGGTHPYAFSWNTTPPQNSQSATGLPAGTYTATVTDANGCTATATATLVDFPNTLSLTTSATPVSSCTALDGTVTVTVPGGSPPYTYQWNTSPLQTTPTATGLPSGTYTVIVADSNGCTKTATATVDDTSGLRVTASSSPADCGFNGRATVFVTGGILPYDILWNTTPPQTTATAIGLSEGVRSVTVTDAVGCRRMVGVTVQRVGASANCGGLSGVVYADLDGDCLQGPLDVGLPHKVVVVDPGRRHVLTGANGAYAAELEHAAYTLDISLPSYAPLCPSPMPFPFALDATTPNATIDVAMDPLFGPDVRALLSTGPHRPGFTVAYHASVHNNGPFTLSNLTLDLHYDPSYTFESATGSPTIVGAGQLRWSVPSLGAFASVDLTAFVTLPPNPALIGTNYTATATVTPPVPDADPTNDSYTATGRVIGAYDPNDKLAMTSSRLSETIWFLDRDDYMDYTIRFQNTGNAEAIDVYVTDTISALHDLTSLKILGASHDFEASLLRDRVLRFDFPNIMLPDSNANEPASHGFVSFRLRPVNGLQMGDRLTNEADIFFDFNPPIRTNTTELTAEFSVGVPDKATFSAQVFPNPVGDVLQVKVLGTGTHAMEVFSLDGRMAMRSSGAGPMMALPVEDLPAGVYVLRVASQDGTMAHARFVKD